MSHYSVSSFASRERYAIRSCITLQDKLLAVGYVAQTHNTIFITTQRQSSSWIDKYFF
ncbi:uncharacterized protein STEHIDRAFT_124003, partial [Stereum hirsutum FP-91666 SS1]|uniref:uncharacterized protein n=1 Tax=Stereum hirsutum (strain FP-91666) TaxID=721885 RepID=UPI000444A136